MIISEELMSAYLEMGAEHVQRAPALSAAKALKEVLDIYAVLDSDPQMLWELAWEATFANAEHLEP